MTWKNEDGDYRHSASGFGWHIWIEPQGNHYRWGVNIDGGIMRFLGSGTNVARGRTASIEDAKVEAEKALRSWVVSVTSGLEVA